jgi:pyrimidine operon attenuation protein / uracil phosphoribosyltransferase
MAHLPSSLPSHVAPHVAPHLVPHPVPRVAAADLLAPEAVASLVNALVAAVQQWAEQASDAPVAVVGIASGGAWLAEHVHAKLGLSGSAGIVSSALHRDDFAARGLAHSTPSRLPVAVEGARVMLIDDVLYTGRTIRAVLNELFDYGRPASVKLAVLVDRGGRELPVQADHCGAIVALAASQTLALQRDADGHFAFTLREH